MSAKHVALDRSVGPRGGIRMPYRLWLIQLSVALPVVLSLVACGNVQVHPDERVKDPGVRGGPAGAGDPLPDLTEGELAFFQAGREQFLEVEGVEEGLGPRFNLDSCGGCHAQPATGGSSPAVNPQVAVATQNGAANIVPSFITLNGPVREVRFKFKADRTPDGGVHNLYTIAGREDAPGCVLAQPDFNREAARDNLIFRIPTPVFGAGLIEAISDETIVANMHAQHSIRAAIGVAGRPNRRGPGRVNTSSNDGSITRFGWKAQNKSLLTFAGEAYNVEQGVTNELFPTERLWGLGQRIFFLHDGRTTDLIEAIEAHASTGDHHVPPSEANAVIARFRALGQGKKQDLLNFLRSL